MKRARMLLAWPGEGEPCLFAELAGRGYQVAAVGDARFDVSVERAAARSLVAWDRTRSGVLPPGWRVLEVGA